MATTHLRPADIEPAGPGGIVVAIDRFAITTNNITYGGWPDLDGLLAKALAPDEEDTCQSGALAR
ncbi:MAG: hypothetical protein R2706_05580 [Acidimicrobiales bacterium]